MRFVISIFRVLGFLNRGLSEHVKLRQSLEKP